MGLDWATKTAKENKYPFFASVFESQQKLEKLWEGASGWRTVKTRAVSAAAPAAKK
jgi:anti-sigma-K factor RskA